MDKINFGKYVELAYEILVVDNQGEAQVFKFDREQPDCFVFGQDLSMIEGFARHIEGLEQGSAFDFTLAPAEAFGERNDDMILELEKSIFNVDGEFDSEKVYEGAWVPMQTDEGYRINGLVTKITDDNVTLDFNHQLAGETVRYRGEVILVPAEVQDFFLVPAEKGTALLEVRMDPRAEDDLVSAPVEE